MDLDTLYRDIQEVKHMIEGVVLTQNQDHELLGYHDKILVRGNGVPSLQETVRTLSNNMSEFIAEVRNERIRREIKEEEERKKVEENWQWWKRFLFGIGVPIVIMFLGQMITFYVKVYPLIIAP